MSETKKLIQIAKGALQNLINNGAAARVAITGRLDTLDNKTSLAVTKFGQIQTILNSLQSQIDDLLTRVSYLETKLLSSSSSSSESSSSSSSSST